MRPFPFVPLALAGSLVLAGCGAPPTIEAAVADDLAGRADTLAARLEAEDPCGAIATAGELVSAAAGGRDAGTVPPGIASEVIATARDTVRGLTCAPEPEPEPEPEPAPPADDGDDRGKGKGEGKGRGDDKGEDDEENDGENDGDDD